MEEKQAIQIKSLEKRGNFWYAISDTKAPTEVGVGKTPEEAVNNLLSALNDE